MSQESIRINTELVRQLREYQQATGVPISKCIEEAVTTWLQCIAPTRIEAMNRPVFGGGPALVSGRHPHVTEEDLIAQVKERGKAKGKK